MKYLEWNNIIAQHFFNNDQTGKDIYLFITKQEIINLGKQYFHSETDYEIWNDFLKKLLTGLPGSDSSLNIFEKAQHAFKQWKVERCKKIYGLAQDYPPYISCLVFTVLPLIEIQGDYNSNNYYDRLDEFLVKNSIKNNLRNKLKLINDLWPDLERWANENNKGELGLFRGVVFKHSTWIYVGKPFSQCILPPSAINKLPELFFEAGLIPDSVYSKAELGNIILKHGSKVLCLKESTIELIKKSDSNELGQSIIEIVKREYKKWTGEAHQDEVDGETRRTRRNYTVASLFLQFKINENSGQISFSYRFFSSNDYPEDLKFGEYENLYETNGWSKTLNNDFKEAIELRDDFNKWVARFPVREVRLFVSAGTFQLSSSYWIETETLSKTDPMFLLCKTEKKQSIIEWSKTFRNGNFREEDFEGLPENYSLFKIINPSKSHPDIPLLKLYTEKRIELAGGLNINLRTFSNDFLPEVVIANADGHEKVYLQYRNTEEKIFLIKKQSNSTRWLLPDDTLLNLDFFIKVEAENFAGNEIAYNLVSSNDSALKVDGVQLPKRDSFGRNANDDAQQYCLGSNIINPTRASQRTYCAWANLFITLNEEFTEQVTSPSFNNHCGNMLSSFLTLKNVLTTEEFYRAFEFYYSKEFAERQATGNFNLSKTKKSSLNFYDYIGFLDYDYETKKIVVTPPQLIFIPSNQGRKVLLIGGRDASLVNSIITTAPKYNLQVEIRKQFSSNERLLLPDVILIKSFGKQAEGAGERNISAFANEMKIKFSQQDFIQIALQLFSAEIKEYEKELLTNNETLQEDYGWARRIFNPENLSYERNEAQTFDKSFSLHLKNQQSIFQRG